MKELFKIIGVAVLFLCWSVGMILWGFSDGYKKSNAETVKINAKTIDTVVRNPEKTWKIEFYCIPAPKHSDSQPVNKESQESRWGLIIAYKQVCPSVILSHGTICHD
jgi:hypothetical protein